MSDERWADLRAKAEAATAGPWQVGIDDPTLVFNVEHIAGRDIATEVITECRLDISATVAEANAAYIAAASPDVVLALLDRVQELEGICRQAAESVLAYVQGDDFAADRAIAALDRVVMEAKP